MKTWTAFCRDDESATVWISSVKAVTGADAIEAARANCAADWDQSADDITVIGLAPGDINIDWNDCGLEPSQITTFIQEK